MPLCTDCYEEKPDDAFYFNRIAGYRLAKCKECHNAQTQRRRRKRGTRLVGEAARERDRATRRRYRRTSVVARKNRLLIAARKRAREAGMEATIRAADVHWPTHCPVLGLQLDYVTAPGVRRDSRNPSLPSLDRWDNSKGYVPGNVYVISLRANQLKSNGTPDELAAIARYARDGLPVRAP